MLPDHQHPKLVHPPGHFFPCLFLPSTFARPATRSYKKTKVACDFFEQMKSVPDAFQKSLLALDAGSFEVPSSQ